MPGVLVSPGIFSLGHLFPWHFPRAFFPWHFPLAFSPGIFLLGIFSLAFEAMDCEVRNS
jgi:hypothetical protein